MPWSVRRLRVMIDERLGEIARLQQEESFAYLGYWSQRKRNDRARNRMLGKGLYAMGDERCHEAVFLSTHGKHWTIGTLALM
jgi:hypothetical protein